MSDLGYELIRLALHILVLIELFVLSIIMIHLNNFIGFISISIVIGIYN